MKTKSVAGAAHPLRSDSGRGQMPARGTADDGDPPRRHGPTLTPKVLLLLDSGVFSAWSRDETIDIKKYIAYIKRHEHLLFSYVTCDVIPGKFGRKRTAAEVVASGEGTYRNQQIMKEAGLHPIPIFHQEESWSCLERFLADGEPYIGISSSKDKWAKDQRKWLDEVFTALTDSTGRPIVKTHGFGITNPRLLKRYPFYSVDSTTWTLTPGYGQIVVPQLGDNYEKDPTRIVISGVQHNNNTNQKLQYEAMGEMYQEIIKEFLLSDCEVDVPDTRYGTTIRRRALLIYYLGLVKTLKDVRFKQATASLLHRVEPDSKRKGFEVDQLRLMYATNLSKEWSELLNNVGANTRLLSYYELMDKPDQILIDYIMTGAVDEYKKRAPKASFKSETYRNYRRLGQLQRHREYGKRKET